MTAFEITPSFPERFEAEAACAPVKSMPLWRKAIGFLSFVIFLVASLVLLDVLFGQTDSPVRVAALVLGALSYLGFALVFGRLSGAHVRGLQNAAREKGAPWSFTFSERGFGTNGATAQSHYDWSAIDDVIAFRDGTGLRTGVWVFPVANGDLPEGMTPEDFRAAIARWRAS